MRLHRWCWPALIGLILLCAAMPPSLFGVGYVSDRIPLVVALLLVSALAMSHPMGRGVRAVLAALFAIGRVRIAAIRSEERRVGKEWVSAGGSRSSPDH